MNKNLIRKYENFIKNNQANLEYQINRLENIEDIAERVDFAVRLSTELTYRNIGYFYSTKIEKVFTDYAKSITVDLSSEYTKDSFLHVATVFYKTGGHSRVIERWIKYANENQSHSIVLINQGDIEIPDYVREIVNRKNGKILIIDAGLSLKEKAIKLRQLASNFEYVVLHTHMDDPIATIAFGTESFKRPILLYNHAEHLFWLGKSIADLVLEIGASKNVSKEKRLIDNTFELGIPQEFEYVDKSNDMLVSRKRLGIDKNKKIISLIGGANKFISFNGKNISDVLMKLLKLRKDLEFYIIGPTTEDLYWSNVEKKSKGKIHVIGQVNYGEKLYDYINSSNLIISSWPMGGGTIVNDVLACKKPYFHLINPLGHLKYLENTDSICNSEQELIIKTIKCLDDLGYSNEVYQRLQDNFNKFCNKDIFKQKLDELVQIAPKEHKVSDISSEIEPKDIDEHVLLLNTIYNENFQKFVESKKFKLFNIEKTKTKKTFTILGIKLTVKRKKRIKKYSYKLFKNKYDLILSIGEDCACSSYLRRCSLQNYSFPFDWLTKAPFENRIKLLLNNFDGFMDKKNLRKIPKNTSGPVDTKCDYYEDSLNDIYFYHDFRVSHDFDEEYQIVKEKFDRRINRLYGEIEKSNKILFVWWSRDKHLDTNIIEKAYDDLLLKFPNKNINILIIEYGSTEKNVELKNKHILKMQYDNISYKLDPTWSIVMGQEENNMNVFLNIKLKHDFSWYFKCAILEIKKYFIKICPFVADKDTLIKNLEFEFKKNKL
ncbi:MAG: DUF1796 family putative cysteine peptidase [Candidatus Gastranaerophilaceae bacterium]